MNVKPSHKSADLSRWVIYGLLSTTTAALGIICLLLKWNDVGVSLLAAGIASALFLVQRVVDDFAERDDRANEARALDDLGVLVQSQELTTERLRQAISETFVGLGKRADDRVIAHRHLTAESGRLLADSPTDSTLLVDAIGISLKQLVLDHHSFLADCRKLQARLIVLDPDSPLFDLSVRQEGRDAAVMRAQVGFVLSRVGEMREERLARAWPPGIEVRLFDGIMTVTGMRVGSTWFFRPRFTNESNNFEFFFEPYGETSPECFGMVCTQFESLWELARPWDAGEQPE